MTSARTHAGAIECVGIEWDLASSEGPVLAFFGSERDVTALVGEAAL